MSDVRYVAFLRAVNVGGRTVKMGELAKHFTALGFTDVSTFIASGNVLFTAPKADPGKLGRRIEEALFAWLGFPVASMIRTANELERLVASNPYKGVPRNRDAKLYVAFLWERPPRKVKVPVTFVRDGLKLFKLDGLEAFCISVRVEGKFGQPNLTLEKTLGVPATTRNWNTVLRITARIAAAKAAP